jgi:hypothetical protein
MKSDPSQPRSNKSTKEIDKILFDTENGGFIMFENYTKSQYCVELVYCWSEIQSFKKFNPEKDQEEMRKLADDLFQNFLHENSPLLVSVSSKSLKNIGLIFLTTDTFDEIFLTTDTFDEILEEIYSLLSDIYKRMRGTTEFAKYTEITKIKNEQGKDN